MPIKIFSLTQLQGLSADKWRLASTEYLSLFSSISTMSSSYLFISKSEICTFFQATIVVFNPPFFSFIQALQFTLVSVLYFFLMIHRDTAYAF